MPIAGDRPRGWKSTFAQTVRLLGGGSWGEVSLKKDKVKVTDVPEGSEDELRHFLEGVVQQANATHVDRPRTPTTRRTTADDSGTTMTTMTPTPA